MVHYSALKCTLNVMSISIFSWSEQSPCSASYFRTNSLRSRLLKVEHDLEENFGHVQQRPSLHNPASPAIIIHGIEPTHTRLGCDHFVVMTCQNYLSLIAVWKSPWPDDPDFCSYDVWSGWRGGIKGTRYDTELPIHVGMICHHVDGESWEIGTRVRCFTFDCFQESLKGWHVSNRIFPFSFR